jgi:hypothetical protein
MSDDQKGKDYSIEETVRAQKGLCELAGLGRERPQ